MTNRVDTAFHLEALHRVKNIGSFIPPKHDIEKGSVLTQFVSFLASEKLFRPAEMMEKGVNHDCEETTLYSKSLLQKASQGEYNTVEKDEGKKTDASYTRKQKLILLSTSIGNFFSFSCASLPAPFLPQLNERHNIKSDLTGWIIGLFSLTLLILGPVFGKMMRKVRMHTVFTSGLFICGVMTILFGCLAYVPFPDSTNKKIDTTYLLLTTVLRTGQAIGAAAVATSAMTILSTAFPGNTIKVLGYGETVIGLGVTCGPAIGGGLFKLGGFMTVFGGVGALIVMSTVLTWFLLPRDIEFGSHDKKNRSMSSLLSNVYMVVSLVVAMSTGVLWASVQPVLEPELRSKFGLSQEISALIFLLIPLSYTITTPLVGKALNKYKSLDLIYVMMVAYGICLIDFIFMGPTPLFSNLPRPLWLLLLTLFIQGILTAFVVIPSMELAFNKCGIKTNNEQTPDAALMAMISGTWLSAYAVGEFLGPTISGVVAEYANFGWAMTVYGFMCLAFVLMMIIIKLYECMKKNRPSHKTSGENTRNAIPMTMVDECKPLLK